MVDEHYIQPNEGQSEKPAVGRACLGAIRSVYPALTPKEREVADFMLNEPEVIHLSITEVVKQSGVGYGSIMRFCQRLGYSGFHDFKLHLAQDLARRSSPLEGSDPLTTAAGKAFEDIRNTVQVLSRDDFYGAADALADARSVLAAGVAASAVTAMELEYRLIRLGINVSAVADAHMQRVRCALMGPEDVVVLVSFSGATRDLLAVAGVAKDAGARIIVLTNYLLSPLCEVADFKLITAIDTDPLGAEIASRAAAAFLVDALCRQITANREVSESILIRTSEAVRDAQL